MVSKRLIINHNQRNNQNVIGNLVRPHWIKTRVTNASVFDETNTTVSGQRLNTVCSEAACPNIGECWSKRHATVMILGSVCTRACAFCNVATGKPEIVDEEEPQRVASFVKQLQLRHVVITSVDRDDLKDGGAQHFFNVISEIRKILPTITIEVLTPDFLRKDGALSIVIQANPDVFNHNIETVPRLYPSIRPGARYFHSMKILNDAKQMQPHLFIKSGLMLGLGESKEEVLQVMDDMRCADVDFLTLGQYLRPTPKHAAVQEYIHPKQFEEYAQIAKAKGFLQVSSSPMTRSSYHADSDFEMLRNKRRASLSH